MGRMQQTCAHARRIGLGTLIFTEHLDLDSYITDSVDVMEHQRSLHVDGRLHPLPFEAERYFEAVDRCRSQFPELQILTGVEYGQPHLCDSRVGDVVDLDLFDRVIGSLHTLPFSDDCAEPSTMYRHLPAEDVMWSYLEEIARMITGSDTFTVLTHIDYAVRSWPSATQGPFDPRRFEEGFRAAMRALAESDRILELNTRQLGHWVPKWWAEEGGRAVTFGSDAHEPQFLATGFPEATLMAESCGFGPGATPQDPWTR